MLQKLQTIGEDFCGLDVNTPLGGETPMAAVPVLVFNTHLTAIAATSTGDYTVVFVGTSKGHLKKVSHHSIIGPGKVVNACDVGLWPRIGSSPTTSGSQPSLSYRANYLKKKNGIGLLKQRGLSMN